MTKKCNESGAFKRMKILKKDEIMRSRSQSTVLVRETKALSSLFPKSYVRPQSLRVLEEGRKEGRNNGRGLEQITPDQ